VPGNSGRKIPNSQSGAKGTHALAHLIAPLGPLQTKSRNLTCDMPPLCPRLVQIELLKGVPHAFTQLSLDYNFLEEFVDVELDCGVKQAHIQDDACLNWFSSF
jgi:hypothetical protein